MLLVCDAAAAFDVLMADSNLNQSLGREAGGITAIVIALSELGKAGSHPLTEMVVNQPVMTPAKGTAEIAYFRSYLLLSVVRDNVHPRWGI